jgi:hypothetical protein
MVPPPLDLDRERRAEERADEHDDGEHADAREGRRDGDRADDVAGDQELEPEEDRAAEALPALPIRVVPRVTGDERQR